MKRSKFKKDKLGSFVVRRNTLCTRVKERKVNFSNLRSSIPTFLETVLTFSQESKMMTPLTGPTNHYQSNTFVVPPLGS